LKDVLFRRRCVANSLSKDLSGSRQWHALKTDGCATLSVKTPIGWRTLF
jgi:hypothetical protein